MNKQKEESSKTRTVLNEFIDAAMKKYYPGAEPEEVKQFSAAYEIGMYESLKRIILHWSVNKKFSPEDTERILKQFIDDMLLRCFQVEKLRRLEYKGFISFLENSFIEGLQAYVS